MIILCIKVKLNIGNFPPEFIITKGITRLRNTVQILIIFFTLVLILSIYNILSLL